MARLQHIVRYPVKGLSGVESEREELIPGSGLRTDRMFAIEHGSRPVENPAGWNPRETYYHLARDESIARFDVALREPDPGAPPVLELAHEGSRVRIRTDPDGFDVDLPAADRFLASALVGESDTPPKLARAQRSLWDWPEAHLSIINLDTLSALGVAADAPVDRRRFRGNLYVSGLGPWGEFSLLGRRISVGDTVLEIVQPTDRCRATTIGPDSAASDLNVPGLLASRFGHMFCGVYARVVTGGTLSRGDEIVLDSENAKPLESATADWPRAARLAEIRQESPSVTSFWFEDPLEVTKAALPGQHIRLHLTGEAAPSWRCYTISAVEENRFRISVKLDGRISTALHRDMSIGDRVGITGPFGSVTIDTNRPDDVVLVSAGVGITPTVAMLRELHARRSTQRIRLVHVDRQASDLALWDEVRDLIAGLPDAQAHLFLTRENAPLETSGSTVRLGRPGTTEFRELLHELDFDDVTAFVCGPTAFSEAVRKTLGDLGLPDERLHHEVFFSPTAAELGEPREPSTSGPHTVRFGETLVSWTRERGTLLDLAEGSGMEWQSGCRMGACGTCVQRLSSGEVEYLTDPIAPVPAGHILACCSVPTGDVGFEK